MEKLIDIMESPTLQLLDLLLKDKSTKGNIIWATSNYEYLGWQFSDKRQIESYLLIQNPSIIMPRIQKSEEMQEERKRSKAEVFTPAWVCNIMNNYSDEEWFGRENVFNLTRSDYTWEPTIEPISFPLDKTWQQYVDTRKLEITCGEAPFLASRYDASTGMTILLKDRIGILDRKFRVINENAASYEEWVKWAIRAFEATYGFEYQGDNLLIARINLLLTFVDYYQDRWDRNPKLDLLKIIANRIVWNIWQMDGLNCTVPHGKLEDIYYQLTLSDLLKNDVEYAGKVDEKVFCKIYNWRRNSSVLVKNLRGFR